jgi:hypothetical protein
VTTTVARLTGGNGWARGLSPVLAAIALAVAALTAGCTAANGEVASASPSTAALVIQPGPSLPACADAGTSVVPSADFPVTFPFPDGTVIVESDTPPGGGTRIRFIVPLEVPEYGEFLERELPKAGLSIGGGEAEADELESKFSGAGLDGQVTAREIVGCPGVLNVQVVIRRT